MADNKYDEVIVINLKSTFCESYSFISHREL
jgi:hypothetical protein